MTYKKEALPGTSNSYFPLAQLGTDFQVAVLDGIEHGLVQGDPDPYPFGLVAAIIHEGR